MKNDIQNLFQSAGDAFVNLLVWPGHAAISYFIEIAPATSAKLGIIGEAAATNSVVVLSILFWFSSVFALWLTYRLMHNIARIVVSTYSTVAFRVSELIYSIKTGINCRLKKLGRHKVTDTADPTGQLEMDDLDMAILRCAAAAGPGFAISAPELAEQLTLRPRQIQACLEKLSQNKILSTAIGSTDGFSNYCLSDYGAAFSRMLTSRQSAVA